MTKTNKLSVNLETPGDCSEELLAWFDDWRKRHEPYLSRKQAFLKCLSIIREQDQKKG
jgi:hypothetical protein